MCERHRSGKLNQLPKTMKFDQGSFGSTTKVSITTGPDIHTDQTSLDLWFGQHDLDLLRL